MITERAEAIAELKRFGARRSAALEWICPQISDATLRDIARCDYGFDSDLNFKRLVQVRNTRRSPTPLEWNPAEVLRLTRWNRCEHDSIAQHQTRYFACAALIDAEEPDEGYGYTAIQLVESAGELGLDACRAALQSIAVLVFKDGEYTSTRDDFALATCVVFLAAALRPELHDPTLIPYLIDAARAAAAEWGVNDDGGRGFVDMGWHGPTFRRAARRFLTPAVAPAATVPMPESRAESSQPRELHDWIEREIAAFRDAF